MPEYPLEGPLATHHPVIDVITAFTSPTMTNSNRTSIGGALKWHRLDEKRACRIQTPIDGGYRSDESQWQGIIEEMVGTMIRLERALSPSIAKIKART